ncbi:MAG: hypothetical protein ACM3SY_20215 [Candidatus Omnitrophota bacterium]
MITKKKTVDVEDVQTSFKNAIMEKRFLELANLMALTGETPADYHIRMGFRMYMEKQRSNRVKLFFVMKLKEITKVSPEDDIIEEIVKTSFEMKSPHILDSICQRLEIGTNIFKNLNDELQEAYLDYVKSGAFTNVEKLMDVTRINPSEQIIQRAYEHYLMEGKLISFTGLKRRTGIAPDRKMILNIMKYYQENSAKYDQENRKNPEGNSWKKRLERLRKAMGTKANEKENPNQEE